MSLEALARPPSDDVLDDAMQKKLNGDKIQLRVENEQYLRTHPEIKSILSFFMQRVLEDQPNDIHVFAAELFADPELEQKVTQFSRSRNGTHSTKEP
ncbi:RIIa domain-containing protein 1 [Gaertneriomyces sp. JEL0708]|nr:RIIa domain-containing protein 1 [Gaertneriomyces sp. JEL0708]